MCPKGYLYHLPAFNCRQTVRRGQMTRANKSKQRSAGARGPPVLCFGQLSGPARQFAPTGCQRSCKRACGMTKLVHGHPGTEDAPEQARKRKCCLCTNLDAGTGIAQNTERRVKALTKSRGLGLVGKNLRGASARKEGQGKVCPGTAHSGRARWFQQSGAPFPWCLASQGALAWRFFPSGPSCARCRDLFLLDLGGA